MVDAHDGAHHRLKVLVLEGHFVAAPEVVARWPLWRGRRRRLGVLCARAVWQFHSRVRQLPLPHCGELAQLHLPLMQGDDLTLEHHAVLPVQELHRLSQVQMAPNLDDPAR
ncbi:MAG: hypothetical protein ACK5YZ_01865, partial [bacterium]